METTEWDGLEARALIEIYLNRPEHAANRSASEG
jgi:hypothetical protein